MPTCSWSQEGCQFCPPSTVLNSPPHREPAYTVRQLVGSTATVTGLPLIAVGPYSSHWGNGGTTNQSNGTVDGPAFCSAAVVAVNQPSPLLFTFKPGSFAVPGMVVASTVNRIVHSGLANRALTPTLVAPAGTVAVPVVYPVPTGRGPKPGTVCGPNV